MKFEVSEIDIDNNRRINAIELLRELTGFHGLDDIQIVIAVYTELISLRAKYENNNE